MNRNVQALRNYRKKHNYQRLVFSRNPVLVMGLALPFAVVATTSLKNGVAMSMEMLMIHLPAMMLALLVKRVLPVPRWIRVLVNVFCTTALMVVARALIVFVFQDIPNTMGAYLYLMSVNSMTLIQADALPRRAKVGSVFASAYMNIVGFAMVVCLLSVLREVVGNGTLWGIAVPWSFKLRGLLTPFSGFILVGMLLALTKWLNRKFIGLLLITNQNRL